MARLLDHLRRQILWCSAVRQPPIVIIEIVGPPEVSHLDDTVGVQQNVLRLDVSMDDRRVQGVKIIYSRYALSEILSRGLFVKSPLLFEKGVDLALGAVLQDKIEVVVVFVVVVKLQDMVVIKLVHDLDFKLDLLNQVMLYDFLLVNDLDGEHVFRDLVAHLVNLPEATNTDVRVGDGLEVVLAALPLLTPHDRGRQKEDPALDVVALVFQLRRDLDGSNHCLLLLLAHRNIKSIS